MKLIYKLIHSFIANNPFTKGIMNYRLYREYCSDKILHLSDYLVLITYARKHGVLLDKVDGWKDIIRDDMYSIITFDARQNSQQKRRKFLNKINNEWDFYKGHWGGYAQVTLSDNDYETDICSNEISNIAKELGKDVDRLLDVLVGTSKDVDDYIDSL